MTENEEVLQKQNEVVTPQGVEESGDVLKETELSEKEATPLEVEEEEKSTSDSLPEDVESETDSDSTLLIHNVLETQKSVLGILERLEKSFEERIKHAEFEDKVIDNMHRELQKYKDDLYASLILPVLKDVIQVRSSIKLTSEMFQGHSEEDAVIPLDTFLTYEQELKDILEKNDIVIEEAIIGETFEPLKQRVVKKVQTADETLHGKIADIKSDSYCYNGKVIVPAKVSVYVYHQNAEKSEVIENG